MAREYGNDRAEIIALRVNEQEKAQIKAAAKNLGISVSQLLRNVVNNFLEKEVK